MENILDTTLEEIIECAKSCKLKNYGYLDNSKQINEFSKNVKNFQEACSKFHNLVEDFFMELENQSFEEWEEAQRNAEKDYYLEEVENGESY